MRSCWTPKLQGLTQMRGCSMGACWAPCQAQEEMMLPQGLP